MTYRIKQALIGSTLAVAIAVGATVAISPTADAAPLDGSAQVESGLQHPDIEEDPGVASRALADALAIGVDELEAAREVARDAAIEDALEAGAITSEQAEALRAGERPRGRPAVRLIARDLYLADALGIDTDSLHAARIVARESRIEAALEAGRISAERAERLSAVNRVAGVVNPLEILADTLGITVEELEAAHDDGTLRDMVADLDRDTLREALRAARDAAIDQAVVEGLISAEQAETLGEQPLRPLRRGLRHRLGR